MTPTNERPAKERCGTVLDGKLCGRDKSHPVHSHVFGHRYRKFKEVRDDPK
jgi:hypothetical protein